MKRRVLLVGCVLVIAWCSITSVLALTETWTMTIELSPAVVSLPQTAMVTVSLSHTGSSENALAYCDVQAGWIETTSSGIYRLSDNQVLWAGNVMTDTPTIFSFTVRPQRWPLTTIPCAMLDQGSVQPSVTGTLTVIPYQVWMPLIQVSPSSTVDLTGTPVAVYPAGNWLIQSEGNNLASAAAGSNLTVWRFDRTAVTLNQPPSVSGNPYYVVRSLLSFDLSAQPAGRVITAWLELYTYNTWYGQFDLRFSRGHWTVPPTASDWNAFDEVLGVYDAGQWSLGTLSLTVGLPGLVGQPRPASLQLTLAGDEVTELPVGALESLRSSIALQLPEVARPMTSPATPISRLHLLIEPEAAR